ncbi:MAG: methyltransferase domain-containing protein [Cyanobacteria bacterium P01_E01_bin.42]
MMKLKCKICETETHLFFKAVILEKYEVDYFQCPNCGFIQTENPYWLEEAYIQPIAKSDHGLIARNIYLAKYTANIIFNLFNQEKKFLDFGSGYGLFVRLMQDLGLDFYGYDPFCQNIFSSERTVTTLQEQYELIVAFEVFEHFLDPLQEVEKLLKISENILFSTEILPEDNPTPDRWYYYALDEGQHISLFTVSSLEIMAEKFNLNLYSNGKFLHLLTSKNLPKNLSNLLNFQHCETQDIYPEFREILLQNVNIYDEKYLQRNQVRTQRLNKFTLIIDGVFFQRYATGIARVWQSLLREWSKTGFANHIIVLDRGGTSPKIPGISYRQIPAHDYNSLERDRALLQSICEEEEASLFISTYYTTPISTPSVFMGYDMIPEILGGNLQEPMWKEKHHGIEHASAYITISENTAKDLVRCFPNIFPNRVTVAPCGINPSFTPANPREIEGFKTKYNITKPYFLLIGLNTGYKNATFFFQSFSQLPTRLSFELVCTGDGRAIEQELRQYTPGNSIHKLQLQDNELRLAYAGAIALVYPSKYEGFGLPVLEAMACGCPVITTPYSSLPEVAGEAAIYIQDGDFEGMINALCDVQKPSIRQSMIIAGLQRAKKFSWSKMASIIQNVLLETTLSFLNLQENNFIIFPDWSQEEEAIAQSIQPVLLSLAVHSESRLITLLIEASSIPAEQANLLVSGIVMNLLMNEEFCLEEGMEISIVPQLSEIQWETLCRQIRGRILLERENSTTISKAKNILEFSLESLTV